MPAARVYTVVFLSINSHILAISQFRMILNYGNVKKTKKIVLLVYSILSKFAVLCNE